MRPTYTPLSLESALLGQTAPWREDRKTWRRKKKRGDGSIRVSRPRTSAEDRDLRDRYAALLARLGSNDAGAQRQAEELNNCTRRHPCGNAGCPACLGVLQHGFVSVVTKFMKSADALKGPIYAVSLVPADEMVKRSELATLHLVNFRRRIRERLQAIIPHCAWLILGIDLSLNEDAQKRWKPKWSPHLYGFVQTHLSQSKLKAELKELLPAHKPLVRRPVKVKEFKPSRYGVSYLIKPDFKRRITYPHSKGDRSKYAPLRRRRRAELQQVLRWLDSTRISDRLLLIGLKTIRSNKRVKIIPVATDSARKPYRHCRQNTGQRTLRPAVKAPKRGIR